MSREICPKPSSSAASRLHHRIPHALSALGTPAAIAALTTTGVSHADDRVRAESLAVLLQAGALPDAEAYKPLMKLAQESADSEARITAVMATRLVGDRHLATPILVLALDDPELILRLHAYEGLCHRYGLRATHIGDVMSAFALGLGSRFASRRSRAQRGLTSTFMGLKRGATPESLGVEESRETPR
jgi:HEAT repeat protein